MKGRLEAIESKALTNEYHHTYLLEVLARYSVIGSGLLLVLPYHLRRYAFASLRRLLSDYISFILESSLLPHP